MPPLPDRTDWLDPEDEDAEPASEESRRVDVDIEVCLFSGPGTMADKQIDESWLLTEEEMHSLERDFKAEDEGRTLNA
jgi:hypothetical protein